MNKEQLGFDPTILTLDGKWYIEIVCNNQTKHLIFDKVIKQAPYIVSQATTCWKAYYKGDTKTPLVIKDSQQYLKHKKEGKLLHKILKKGVVNMTKYYYNKTVCVSGKKDDIYNNVCKGLNIIKAANYKPEGLMMPTRPTGIQISTKKGQSSSRKRPSSYTNLLLISKHMCLSSLPKGRRPLAIPN